MRTNVTGIIGAMAEEIELIERDLEQNSITVHAGITFHEGMLFGLPVVLCKSGVGKVNAAVCTQILVDRFNVSRIIFTGVAGAVHPELEIGDIVISTECLQHDMDASVLGFARGEIPYAETSVFPADEQLIELASRASDALFDKKVVKGKVLSGDRFIADKQIVRQLYDEFQGTCIEMEGAAVAQVCWMNRVPYVVIRSMSDKADGSAHINFSEFTRLASEHSYRLVEHMMKALGRQVQ